MTGHRQDILTYDHYIAEHVAMYHRRFSITFGRTNALEDNSMRLLSRDLMENTIAVVESVPFAFLMPDKVSAFNPKTNWPDIIAEIVSQNSPRASFALLHD